jgi:apolipoprotein D and lipocalin family protein
MKLLSLAAALSIAATLPGLAAAQAGGAPPAPTGVDYTRWEGRWYEAARLENWPQRNCDADNVATVLRRVDGDISIIHQCRTADGDWYVWVGDGRREDGAPKNTLGVRFAEQWLTMPPFFWTGYYAVALDVDARYALLGTDDGAHLWVLSQTRTMDEAVYQRAIALAGQLGYDTAKLIRSAK